MKKEAKKVTEQQTKFTPNIEQINALIDQWLGRDQVSKKKFKLILKELTGIDLIPTPPALVVMESSVFKEARNDRKVKVVRVDATNNLFMLFEVQSNGTLYPYYASQNPVTLAEIKVWLESNDAVPADKETKAAQPNPDYYKQQGIQR
jgi:hypothetical protein